MDQSISSAENGDPAANGDMSGYVYIISVFNISFEQIDTWKS